MRQRFYFLSDLLNTTLFISAIGLDGSSTDLGKTRRTFLFTPGKPAWQIRRRSRKTQVKYPSVSKIAGASV